MKISPDPKTLIIAEAGVNHNGDLDLARQLVDVAAAAGADYVKFQTFDARRVASASAQKAQYQQATTGTGESQLDMLRRLELSPAHHSLLMQHCAARGIAFLSTGFDLQSNDFLRGLGQTLFKIPSGEITNLPYLRQIGAYGGEVILSTGMCSLGDVEAAIAVLTGAGTARAAITVLHCTTEYPAPMRDVNLRAMVTMGQAFGLRYGYSDHTNGIEVPIAAVALGACVIEKHFTTDRALPGPDHKASLEPAELAAMVAAIRNIETALGSATKQRTPSEAANAAVARKSIVAACAIAKGAVFSDENLTTKRPGTGLSPMLWDQVIGRTAPRDFAEDEAITL